MGDELNDVLDFLEALDEGFDEIDEAMTYLWEADDEDDAPPAEDENINFNDIDYDEALLQQEALQEAMDELDENNYVDNNTIELDDDEPEPIIDDDYDGEIVTIDVNAPDIPATEDYYPDDIIDDIFETDDAELAKEVENINDWYYWPDSRWKE